MHDERSESLLAARMSEGAVGSGLFDPVWYRAVYPDVAAAGVDPLAHYLGTGWREERLPGPEFDVLRTGLFDAGWYAERNPDVTGPPAALARHFIANGWAEGRWPNPCFDPDFYLRGNQDVAAQPWHPFLHYVLVGEQEGRRPVPYFDPGWYRHAYAVQDRFALAHYLRARGATSPSAALFAVPLLSQSRALRDAGVDPIAAWLREHPDAEPDGLAAEQLLLAECGLFDAEFYRRFYADIREKNVDPLPHYCRHGWREQRRPNFYFNPVSYVRDNPEAPRLGVNPLLHYIATGAGAGATPGSEFDPAWYARVYADRMSRDEPPLVHFLRNRTERGVAPCPGLYAVPLIARHAAARDPDPFERFVLDRNANGGPGPGECVIAESGLFDVNHYGTEDAAILEADVDPLHHFTHQGWREIRTPNPYFNPRWYMQTNPRAAALGVNPMLHYIAEGEAAGRRPILFFDPAWYRSHYALPDGVSPLRHYLDHRREQAHSPIPEFDVDAFKERYGARVRPGRDAFMVFLALSAREDMEPGPAFDAAEYRRRVMGRRSRYFAKAEEDVIPLLHYLRATYR